ncbi:uncharacterized protein [Periplaneta americana]
MDFLREEYEIKLKQLVKDLTKTHKGEIENMESKHEKEMQNEKLSLDSTKDVNNIRLKCAKEVEKVKAEVTEAHGTQLNRLKDIFEEELKRHTQTLLNKKEEEENVATIKSELLNKDVTDIKKLEDSFADHVVDEMGKTRTDTALQKLYTSDCVVVSSDSKGDFHDSILIFLLIEKDTEIIVLKNELTDRLRKEKEEAVVHLKALEAKPVFGMKDELAAIEVEMDKITKRDSISSDEESALFKQELEKLKAYCKKKAVIEEEKDMLAVKSALLELLVNYLIKENHVLEKQKKQLQDELMGGGCQDEPTLKLLGRIKDETDKLLSENNGLKHRIAGKYVELQKEVAKYQIKVKELEDEKSQNLILEVEDLRNTLESYSVMEDKLIALKQKADDADRLRKELDSLNGDGALLSECDEIKQKLEGLTKADVNVDSIVSGHVQGPNGALEANKKLREKIETPKRAGVDVDDIVSGRVPPPASSEESYESRQKIESLKRAGGDVDVTVSGKVPYSFDAEQRLRYLMSDLKATKRERDDLIERAALASGSQTKLPILLDGLESITKELGALKQDKDSLKRQRDVMMEKRDALKLQFEDFRREYAGYCAELEERTRMIRSLSNDLRSISRGREFRDSFAIPLYVANLHAERDMLKMRVEDYICLDAELNSLPYKEKELDVLKIYYEELQKVYLDLVEKTRNMEVIAAERNRSESEINAQRNCVQLLEGAYKENELLKGQISELRCVIGDKGNEIKRLLIQVDSLSLDAEERQIVKVCSAVQKANASIHECTKRVQENLTMTKKTHCSLACLRIAHHNCSCYFRI